MSLWKHCDATLKERTCGARRQKGGKVREKSIGHKFIYHNSGIARPISVSQCKCWTFREKITSPGAGADGEKLSRLQWSDKEGEVKLSSEWHKSVPRRIDAQIILYAKTGTPQYITVPGRDILARGDTTDPSLGGTRVFWLFFTGARVGGRHWIPNIRHTERRDT